MGTLQLLALIYTAGFAFLFFSQASQRRSSAHFAAGAGFAFLALGFVAELTLGFALDYNAARLFYWARGMVALAWFGQALLLHFFAANSNVHRLTYLLIAGSLIGLGLVLLSQVTRAEDWFVAAKPIYGQINDLLATNRPTRWGPLLLNSYGLATLIGAAIWATKERRQWLAAAALITGGLALYIPLYLQPTESTLLFSLIELLTPALLFLGLMILLSTKKATK